MRRTAFFALATSPATVAAQVATVAPAGAALPGAGIVTDAIGGASGWAFDKMATGVAGWVLGGVAYFADGVLNFLKTSGRPQVEAAWFSGPGSPLATVRSLAGVLIVGFLFLGLLQGLVAGDTGAMVRRLAADLPLAVLGMVATVAVTAKLLDLTDALSTAVLDQSHGKALQFLAGFGTLAVGTQGFAVVVVGLLAILAALLLWVELMIRSALVYLLVAISPLAFAAMVWPAARGVLRRTAHLLLAVILSKFVIAVALAVGVAALAGTATTDGNTVGASMLGGPSPGALDDPAVGLGTLLVGGVILAMAAFAPFIVLRLIPVAEAALVAQGISRGPARATQSGLGTYYYTNSITRLGGSAAPGGSTAPSAGGGPIPTLPGATAPAATTATGTGGGAGAAVTAASAARAAGRQVTSTARGATDLEPPAHQPTPPRATGQRDSAPRRPDPPRRNP